MRAVGTGPNSEFVVQNELARSAPRYHFNRRKDGFSSGCHSWEGHRPKQGLGAGLFQDTVEIMRTLDAQTISMLEAWPL